HTCRRGDDSFGDGELHDRTVGGSRREGERRLFAKAGAHRAAYNRSSVDVGLGLRPLFGEPDAAGAVGAGHRFGVDDDPSDVFYLARADKARYEQGGEIVWRGS